MTAMRSIQDNISDSSDSSDSSSFANHPDGGASAVINNLSVYKTDPLKCNSFANKLDAYNNNQLLLPAQFYKTLLAKAVLSSSNSDDKTSIYKNMLFHKDRDFDQKAFGWDGTQSGASPAGPQSGGVGGQGAQGLVHWMSVMAEHMDPAVSHYMSWNQEQCGQHGKDDYPNWTRGSMGMNKQGYESKMNENQHQMQKGSNYHLGKLGSSIGAPNRIQCPNYSNQYRKGMEDHHMGTPGLYTSGRSTSSSSSPGVAGSSPALLVVPQPINATKMGGMQNGGPQPRKYQCKMCPQSHGEERFAPRCKAVPAKSSEPVPPNFELEGRVEYRSGGLDFQAPMHLDNANYSHLQRSIDSLRSLGDRLGERNVDLRLNLHHNERNGLGHNSNNLALNRPFNERDFLQGRPQERNLSFERLMGERNLSDRNLGDRNLGDRNLGDRNLGDRCLSDRGLSDHRGLSFDRSVSAERLSLERSLIAQNANRGLGERNPLGGGVAVDRNGAERLRSGLDMREMNSDVRQNMNEMKFRDYKAHLDSLRNMESSRSIEGKNDEERGTPSSPSTPLSVGEGFPEEKVFGSKAELQLHTQAHMREAKPYKCSQCCKAFANSSYLSQHTRIHLGIKPYRCEICQRKFTQLSHLQQHIRTHTGDKPYKCRHPGCQKAFSQLSNLQSHSRCHQTDKPYKCNSCYKCFSDEPSLLEHIPKHKESKHLKTHICQYCGKSYTQETYLQKHMQKHAERTDKRPPIGHSLGLNHRGLDHPYWPKVSPDSAENMHDYPTDIPRQILEQNEDLVIIRQQLGQNPPAPPSTPNPNLSNSYDTTITKSNSNSAFTPISSMSGHLSHLNHQLAPNRPYLYDAISFQKQNSLDLPKTQPSNGFPNQLISLHQIRNYAHQPNSNLMEHSILGGLKDK